jgi:predicted dehydrogenase
LGIGTHALMQLRYVTGLEVERLSAHLENFVETGVPEEFRQDDHFTAYCQMDNGSRALVRASQIAIGHKNDLQIEVTGKRGSVRWSQEESDKLVVNLIDQPERVYWRGGIHANDGFLKDLPQDLMDESTIPWGHSEGFHDAFARLHRCFEIDVRSYQAGNYAGTDGSKYATVEDGVIGLRFIEKAVESNKSGNAWVNL